MFKLFPESAKHTFMFYILGQVHEVLFTPVKHKLMFYTLPQER